MTPQPYRTVLKRIHPPEADQIAAVYHRARNEIEQSRAVLAQILAELDAEWEGIQKNLFMDRTQTRLKRLVEYENYLMERERLFRTIEVTIEVQEPIVG